MLDIVAFGNIFLIHSSCSFTCKSSSKIQIMEVAILLVVAGAVVVVVTYGCCNSGGSSSMNE